MRKLNDINAFIESQVDYYENNEDYAGNYLDDLGHRLQYDGCYDEDAINAILESDLTTSTDYSYLADDAVAVYSIGEIEIEIITNLTQKEYDAIEGGINAPTSYHNGTIYAYVCAGMNIRVYSDYKGANND